MSRKLGTGNLKRLEAMSRGALAVFAEPENGTKIVYPDIAWIEANPNQPRRHFDAAELEALQDSIQKHGLQQPIGVRELGPSRFQLVFGERRLRAVRALGQHTIACVLVPDGVDAAEVTVIENILRTDLTPFEEADAFIALVAHHGYSHADLGQIMGRDKAEITKTIALAKVSTEVRERYNAHPKKVARYKLYQIAALNDPATQMHLWETLVSKQPTTGITDSLSDGNNEQSFRQGQRSRTEAPEVILSAFSLQVSRNILRTREAFHAFQEKPKQLEDIDREVLRDMRDVIETILSGELA
jgi:ParB family chromosome partitioning protein